MTRNLERESRTGEYQVVSGERSCDLKNRLAWEVPGVPIDLERGAFGSPAGDGLASVFLG